MEEGRHRMGPCERAQTYLRTPTKRGSTANAVRHKLQNGDRLISLEKR